MADTFARVGDAVVGYAVTGTSDMPDFSGDHFTWEGHCWEAVTDPGLLVATMDPAASPAAKEALTARIVQAMSVATKKLVVTEEAILNHATLIGQTVVDDINVQGKLIGTDGVFTGTVDFANINVTDEVLAARISGEHIYGTTIEGGLFKTSDALPGQVELADNGYMPSWDDSSSGYPGIRVEPIDNSTTAIPPGIGSYGDGVIIDGGKATDGRSSYAVSNPRAFFARTFRTDGTKGGEVHTSPDESLICTYREDGATGGAVYTSPAQSLMRTFSGNSSESGWVRVRPQDAEIAYVDPNNTYFSRIKADANEAFIYTRAGGANRYLTVDADGVWVKTNKSGSWKQYNLEETAQDSGWINIAFNSGFQRNGSNSPFQYRRVGNMCYLRGRIERTSGTFALNTAYNIGSIPSADGPSYLQRTIVGSGPSTSWCRVDVSPGGNINVAFTDSSLTSPAWIDLTGTYWTRD